MFDAAVHSTLPDSTPAPRASNTLPVPEVPGSDSKATGQRKPQKKFLSRGSGIGGGRGCQGMVVKTKKKSNVVVWEDQDQDKNKTEIFAPKPAVKEKIADENPKQKEKEESVNKRPRMAKMNYFGEDSDSDGASTYRDLMI